MAVRLVVGDCIDELKKLPSDSIDSIVTDPPYGLTQNKKGGSGVASASTDTPYGRAKIGTGNGAGGFMGMKWDASVPGVEMWSEALRVLKPGGHLISFGGSRTYHRMAVAIEDAGFEIRDQIMWLYGSGFPKSHNGPWGGTALKPAHEPCVLARKPFPTTVAENVLEHGTGALNIDCCRVKFDGKPPEGSGKRSSAIVGDERAGAALGMYGPSDNGGNQTSEAGRWPANVILDEEAGAILDHAQGETGHSEKLEGGGASRFFYCAKPSRAERDAGIEEMNGNVGPKGHGLRRVCEFCGVLALNPQECKCEVKSWVNPPRKNFHPTVKPVDLMRYLCRLITPPGGVVLDPFMGSGTTGIAAIQEGFDFVGIEREDDYAEIAAARIAHWGNAVLTELGDGSVELELPPEAEWL